MLKELMSMEGVLMIGAALVAPMAADWVQQTVMPTATGYTKLAVKAAVVAAGAYALHKFAKQHKAALAFGVTGTAVLVSDLIKIVQGTMSGLSAEAADALANSPSAARMLVRHPGYRPSLADGYRRGLADPTFKSAFSPSFG